MTNLITEARELCEKATPGPWGSRIDVGKKYYVFTPSYGVRDFCCLSGGFEHESDAAFIARSRTLIPELCDALEKAKEQNKQLLREVSNLAAESVKRDVTLARLEAEVVTARNAVAWIPVTERLPEVDESGDVDVLVHMDDGFIATCTYDRNASYIASDCWLLWRDAGNVTHWMPLPEPPEEGAEHE